MAVIRRVCSQQNINIATFPLEDFTLIQLEQTAIAPRRIRSLFTIPGLEQPIRPAKVHQDMRGIKQAHLVSGGRFLVTISTSKLLQLWDIGFVWDTLLDWQPLASVQIISDLFSCFEVLPARDGNGLHVILKEDRR
jgi:hypothetical protein